jgi:hypothetical protein
LWLITLGDAPFDFVDGDVAEVDPSAGTIIGKKTGKKSAGAPLTGFAVEIVRAGGATKYFLPYVLHPAGGKPEQVKNLL